MSNTYNALIHAKQDGTGEEVANNKTGGGSDLSDYAKQEELSNLVLTGTTNTSGATIAAGTCFVLNGDFVTAKTDIASGATFTLNTNYEKKSVGSILTELNDKTMVTTDMYNVTNTKMNSCEVYSCITNNFICLGILLEVNDATQPVTLTFNNDIPQLGYGSVLFLNYSGFAANSQITSSAVIIGRTITFPANLPFNYIRLHITHPLA